MITLGSFVGLFFGIFVSLSLAQSSTTPHFHEVFLGKCFKKNPSGTDCYGLLNNFSAAATVDNSLQNDSLYDPFFTMANFSTPKNNLLFWSGNMAFALAISDNDPRFVTVEQTSTGYIMNGLTWCGTPDNTYNYVSPCYYPSNATYYGSSGVWSRASKIFAEGAAGHVHILLQPGNAGGSPPVFKAFRETSIFGKVELPAMDTTKVEAITVLLLKNTTIAPEETCNSGSLLELNEKIKAKFGFGMTCVDTPAEIYYLLCPPDTSKSSPQCIAATLVYNYEIAQEVETKKSHLTWAIVTTVFCGIFFIISVILVAVVVTMKKRS